MNSLFPFIGGRLVDVCVGVLGGGEEGTESFDRVGYGVELEVFCGCVVVGAVGEGFG